MAMRSAGVVVVAAGIVASFGATRASVTSAPLAPLVVNWQRSFTIDSEVTQRDGRALVTGTVRNTSTCDAQRIQILIDALDAGGNFVDQRIVWLGTDLTPGSHVYFEAPAVQTAASHRVSVFAFESNKRC
jgi:hypothetical protein